MWVQSLAQITAYNLEVKIQMHRKAQKCKSQNHFYHSHKDTLGHLPIEQFITLLFFLSLISTFVELYEKQGHHFAPIHLAISMLNMTLSLVS